MTEKKILIIAEQNLKSLHKVSYELLGKGRELAEALSARLECLLLAADGMPAEELCKRGADTVYYMKSAVFSQPEEMLFKSNIVKFIQEHKPEIVLVAATHFGRSLAPRVAAALETGLTADCTDLKIDAEGQLIQIRPAFSDNLFAHIKTVTLPQMATVRYKEFPEAKREEDRPIHIEVIPPYVKEQMKVTVDEMISLGDGDITEAEVIVAGGRGIRKKEDLQLLAELAQALGGAVGVSRSLVDAGLADSEKQVGYSGNRVKPKVYIACGISGAPQHLAGMKESDRIIAINSDPSAPIFKVADYGLVGDLYQILPMLVKRWKGGENQ